MAEDSQACLKWSGGTVWLSDTCVIGRRSDNDLQINNVQASRRHAVAMRINDDWWLNDLGSRNGVLVNGIRLTSARKLRDGDEIRIAGQRLIFNNVGCPTSGHSSIAGKITQVAEPPSDELQSQAAACDLIVASDSGEILEGEKVALWCFGATLKRMPGAAHSLLPAAVRQWLERSLAQNKAAATTLELQEQDRRVLISLARHKEGRVFLLVREEAASLSLARLVALGLTKREAEVLHWMCEGKKNPEIAQILGISTHTANHHVEHILKKLQVDNRQKAIKAVMERLGS